MNAKIIHVLSHAGSTRGQLFKSVECYMQLWWIAFVHVPDVVPHGQDGCMDIQEQMAAGRAEDNHYQVEGDEDIHKLEAVGQDNKAQGVISMHTCFLSPYNQEVLKSNMPQH